MTPIVSVIIPTYNRCQIIERAINSVLNQTFQNFEILIIDDASTDNTNEHIQSISDSRIRYEKLKINSGGSTARNRGIDLAEGDFVAFLDSDDEWLSNMLELSLEKFVSSNDQQVIIFSKLLMDNKVTKKIFPESIYKAGDLSEYIFCQHGLVSTITLFMPRDVAKSVMFKEKLIKHQDYDFVLRAYRKGVKFHMIDQVLAIWHNEKREDRMGVKVEYEDSFKWLNQNEFLFTDESAKMFIKRDILGQVTREKVLIKAIKFLLKLRSGRYINNRVFFKNVIKVLVSNFR
jgi:glycosyltransferase involved in cell wall biosynthesis